MKTNEWQLIETAPKGRKVIAGYLNGSGMWRTILARYYPKNSLLASDESDTDDEFAPEGWYEETETHCEEMRATEYPPTHWQPLPDPPASARK